MPIELFADNASTTVSSGGTTAPASGTSETWTVASSSSFPAASSTASPATQFRVVDPAQPTEWMTVTNVSGTTWTVTRGASGTPVAHTAGFTVQQVVTAGWLQARDDRSQGTNVKAVFGAKGDGKTVQDGAMTSGSATLTSATAGFTSADVGKQVMVSNATSTSFRLATTIASVTNGTTAVLASAARATQTAQTIVIDGIRTVADAATTNDSTTVTSATAAFTAADVGKKVTVTGAGRMALATTISAFTNSTTVTLAASATRTCTASQVVYGTDDAPAFNKAFLWAGTQTNGPATLFVPRGLFIVKSSNLATPNPMQLYSNTIVRGDGWGTIIRSAGGAANPNLSAEVWGINLGSGGSSDPTTNVTSVTIENLQFQGTIVEEGFLEGADNLLSINACSDVSIRNCKFTGNRSDGIYVGSGTTGPTLERHNQRVRIENCTFDGVNGDGRQGVSIIDGDDILIQNCQFRNIANDLMPGAIDMEPNGSNTFAIVRNIRVLNNTFTMIGGNQGAVCWEINPPQHILTTPCTGGVVANNVFYNMLSSTVGFLFYQPNYPTDSMQRHDLVVTNNVFLGSTTGVGVGYCADVEGARGIDFFNNVWDGSSYSLLIGNNYKCLDVSFKGNTFKDIGYQGGKCIEVVNADRLSFDGNTFEHISPTGGGYVTRFIGANSALPTPSALVLTPSTTGGTLTSGTKAYRVSATKDNGETVACAEVTTTTTGTTGSVLLSWSQTYGASGYKVYGRTSGAELLMTTLSGVTSTTYTDTGSVTPSGALPTGTSTNGSTNGVRFVNNTIRQGSSNSISTINNVVTHTTVANAIQYYGNQVPSNAAMAMGSFIDSTIVYTVAAAATTVDAALVPTGGQIVINTSATAMTSLVVANPVIGQRLVFRFVITATSQVWVGATNMKYAAATAPTHSTVAGRSDILYFVYDGTNWLETNRSLNVG